MKKAKILIKTILVIVIICVFTKLNAQSDSATTKNISPIQVSFVPFFVFNPMPNADGVYLSLNIIGGYVPSVHAVEAGGVFNIVKNDVRAVQAAGVVNFTGKNIDGVQASGVANYARNLNGCQAAGVLNLSDSINGCQVAGVSNLNRNGATGCQIAGIANLNGDKIKGVQTAGAVNVILNIHKDSTTNVLSVQQIGGVCNLALAEITGTQVAGVINLCKTITGAQVAGVCNASGNISGTQIAGVVNLGVGNCMGAQVAGTLNVAEEVNGTQLSGCLNLAKTVTGAQISCFNIADSVNGAAIGVLSFVRNGYHKLEISADEKFYTNIAFRTGMRQFHNILTASIDPSTLKAPLWSFGYGFGTTFGNNEKICYDIDITVQHIQKKEHVTWENNQFKLYFGIDRKLAKNVSIAAGISANMYIADTKSARYKNNYSNFAPYYLSSTNFDNGYNLKTWLGAKVAIRFF